MAERSRDAAELGGVGPAAQAGGAAFADVPQFAQNFAVPVSVPQPVQNYFDCASGPPHSAQNFPPGWRE